MRKFQRHLAPIVVTVIGLTLLLFSTGKVQALVPTVNSKADTASAGHSEYPRAAFGQDEQELAKKSDLIAVGAVDSLYSYWNQERTHIFTQATLSLQRIIKGDAENEIVVVAPGGTADGITEMISDASKFTLEEESLFFLKSEGNGIYSLADRRSGKQAIEGGDVLPLDHPPKQGATPLTGIAGSQGVSAKKVNLGAAVSLERVSRSTNQLAEQAAGGWQYIMNEDFEGTFPTAGWTLSGNPTWGRDDYKPYSGTYSGWCARGGSLGVDPQFYYYPNNVDSSMVYGPFSLSDATAAKLDFCWWLYSELSYDGFGWEASIDGANFYGPALWTGYSGGWLYDSFDLTNVPTLGNLAGQASVWVRFRFHSDSTINSYDGAFVDDIVLAKHVAAGSVPSISSITPSSASAGTGSNVTISGSNFGATQGSGKVTFCYQAGQPRIKAPIVSWSNTCIVATVPVGIINGYRASASSGPVVVATSLGESDGHQFPVTFGYMGAKWPGVSPRVRYRINANCADITGEEAAVQAAANTWSTVAGADFQFVYDGSTSSTNAALNGTNEIMWRDMGATGTIAATYWLNTSGNLVEFDIQFNDSYSWSTTGTAGAYDVQNIAAHELGHALGLRDLYGDVGVPNDTEKTMYGYGDLGQTKKRTLEPDDKAGAVWLYSRPPSVTTNNASNLTPTSARLNGYLDSLGTAGNVTLSFVWGTTAGGPYPNETGGQVMGTTGAFYYDQGGLTQAVTYYYKAKAAGYGIGYGSEKTFSTPTTVTINTSGLPSSFPATVYYTQGGVAKTDTTSDTWSGTVDYGSTLSIDNIFTVSSTERYGTTSTTSWTVTQAAATYSVVYYHQFKSTISAITASTGHADLSATNYASLTCYRFGSPQVFSVFDSQSFCDWVDAGSTVGLSNLSSGSTSTHRWYAPETTSWTVNDASPRSATYWEQFKSVISTVTTGTGHTDLDAANHAILTHYQFGTSRTANVFDAQSFNDWIDIGSMASLSNLSSGSTSTHRWYASETTSWTVNDTSPRSATYWEQFNVTVVPTGLDAAHPATISVVQCGTTNNQSVSASWSEWADVSSTLSISNLVTVSSAERYSTTDTSSWTVGSALTISLDYTHQFLANITITGLSQSHPTAITFVKDGVTKTQAVFDGWSEWVDKGSNLSMCKSVEGGWIGDWSTKATTSWHVDSGISPAVDYGRSYTGVYILVGALAAAITIAVLCILFLLRRR